MLLSGCALQQEKDADVDTSILYCIGACILLDADNETEQTVVTDGRPDSKFQQK